MDVAEAGGDDGGADDDVAEEKSPKISKIPSSLNKSSSVVDLAGRNSK